MSDRTSTDIGQNGDGHRMERQQTLDKTRTNVGQNGDKHLMEQGQMLDGTKTDVRRNGNGRRTEWWNETNYDGVVERPTFASSTAMACKRDFFFFFYFMFIYFYFYSLFLFLLLLPELL
jgi:hypothetical protein